MNREQRRQRERVTRLLQADIAKNGMGNFLNKAFGVGSWEYDAVENLWIVPDKKYVGPGRQYFCVRSDGSWFGASMGQGHTQ
jgi:hypothetical protein